MDARSVLRLDLGGHRALGLGAVSLWPLGVRGGVLGVDAGARGGAAGLRARPRRLLRRAQGGRGHQSRRAGRGLGAARMGGAGPALPRDAGGRNSGIFGIAAMAHSRHPRSMSWATRRVSMVVYPDVQILDVTGPLEVFARTARWLTDRRGRREPAYTVELLAARRGPLRSSSGLELVVHHSFMEVRGGIDTLLVAKRYTPARAAACPRGRARRCESLPGPRPS